MSDGNEFNGATPFVNVNEIRKFSKPKGETSSIPSNPYEYLYNVMEEAGKYPDVIVAATKPLIKKAKNHLDKLLDEETSSDETDAIKSKIYDKLKKYSAAKSWTKSRVTQFAQSREVFTRHLARLKSINRQTKKRPKLPIYPLPPWDDEESWKYFCYGNNLLDNLQKKKDSLVNDIILQQKNLESVDEKDERIIDLSTLKTGLPPLMRILLRMDINQVEANLEYNNKWLTEFGYSHQQGRWIYALLTSLQKPLYPTVISLIRDLARNCKEIRLNEVDNFEESSKSRIYGLNLIISIVSQYFNQTDLSDEESLL